MEVNAPGNTIIRYNENRRSRQSRIMNRNDRSEKLLSGRKLPDKKQRNRRYHYEYHQYK